jgi:hypothetical protein
MYEKIGLNGKFDPEYHGIVGHIDVPYSIIDPQVKIIFNNKVIENQLFCLS